MGIEYEHWIFSSTSILMNYKTEKIPLTHTCIYLIGLRYNVHLQKAFMSNHLWRATVSTLSHYVIVVPLSCGNVVVRRIRIQYHDRGTRCAHNCGVWVRETFGQRELTECQRWYRAIACTTTCKDARHCATSISVC